MTYLAAALSLVIGLIGALTETTRHMGGRKTPTAWGWTLATLLVVSSGFSIAATWHERERDSQRQLALDAQQVVLDFCDERPDRQNQVKADVAAVKADFERVNAAAVDADLRSRYEKIVNNQLDRSVCAQTGNDLRQLGMDERQVILDFCDPNPGIQSRVPGDLARTKATYARLGVGILSSEEQLAYKKLVEERLDHDLVCAKRAP